MTSDQANNAAANIIDLTGFLCDVQLDSAGHPFLLVDDRCGGIDYLFTIGEVENYIDAICSY